MNQINVKKIPQYQLDRLASPLIDAVRKYFSNPQVQQEFEAWQQLRGGGKKAVKNEPN